MRIARELHVVGGLLFALLATSVAAQDANYWALQYGPVAQLLGGQVIGSDRDLSSTYYNPGGLALGEGASVLLSTESVQLETFSTDGSQFELFDTSSTRFGAAPTLVAGSLPRGGWARRPGWPGRFSPGRSSRCAWASDSWIRSVWSQRAAAPPSSTSTTG